MAGLGGFCQVVLKASGVDEAAGGVAGEVSESQGDAAQVLEAPVDGFGGAVGGAGVVEVGQGCRRLFRSGSWPVPGSPPARRGRPASRSR